MKMKVSAIAAALCLLFAVSAFAAEEAPKDAPAPIKYGQNVGDNIQPIVLKSIDGSQTVELAKLNKKTVFVMISSVCTACRKEIQEMTENYDKIKARVDVFGVVIDMDAKSAAERIGATPFPLLADSEFKIGNATNLMSTPTALIVKDGKILYKATGYVPGQWREYVVEK